MRREHAPPGFWPWPGDERALLEGVELESAVPTRFFQTVDPYPRTWGPLHWRVQLNKMVDGRAELPLFRAFYSGVEWNLNHPDYRWLLTAWFRWEHRTGVPAAPPCGPSRPSHIEGKTVVFPISVPDPEFVGSLYLRSRIDARDRERIAEALRSHERATNPEPSLIILDDVLDT